MDEPTPRCIVIGSSAGGLTALPAVLAPLPTGFAACLALVQHTRSDSDGTFLVNHLGRLIHLVTVQGRPGQHMQPGHVVIAPPDHHLLIEPGGTLGLSHDPPVHFARPSIDTLFESAARAFGPRVIGVLLTGANRDGAEGLQAIARDGGTTLVQAPDTAEFDAMPRAALQAGPVDYVLELSSIAPVLIDLVDNHPNR